MDGDGTHSKGIARSLRKLGIVEAEAILEEINPTPLKLIGYGIVFAAAAYSLVEWEKTLQFIAVVGLGQTILGRVGSYQDAEDVRKDVRVLVTPARLGGQAISWVLANLKQTVMDSLHQSPLSSNVQSRVMQAAAKHESGPDETQNSSPITASGNVEVNASEA